MSKRSASELSVDEQQPQSKQRREESDEKAGVAAAAAALPTTANNNSSRSTWSTTSSSSHSMSDTIMNEMNQPTVAAAASAFTSSSASSSSPHSSASAVSVSVSDPIRVCGIDVWHCEQLRHDMNQLVTSITLAASAATGFPSSVAYAFSHTSLPSTLCELVHSSIPMLCECVIDIDRQRQTLRQHAFDDKKWLKGMIRSGGIHALILLTHLQEYSNTPATHTIGAEATSSALSIVASALVPALAPYSSIARNLLEHHFTYSTIASISRQSSLSGKIESALESFLLHDLALIVMEYKSLTKDEEAEIAEFESQLLRCYNVMWRISYEEQAAEKMTAVKASIAAMASTLTQLANTATMEEIASTANMTAELLKSTAHSADAAGIFNKTLTHFNPHSLVLNDSLHGSIRELSFVLTLPSLPQSLAHAILTRDAKLDVMSLVDLLSHRSGLVKCGALRIIFYVIDDESHRHRFLACTHLFQSLKVLLIHPILPQIRYNSILLIVKLISPPAIFNRLLINSTPMMMPLVTALSSEDNNIQRIAVTTLSRALQIASGAEICAIGMAAIPPLCAMLNVPDDEIIMVSLEGLEAILKFEETIRRVHYNVFSNSVKDAKGLDCMKTLQQHTNKDIQNKVVSMLQTYFVPTVVVHTSTLEAGNPIAHFASSGSKGPKSNTKKPAVRWFKG